MFAYKNCIIASIARPTEILLHRIQFLHILARVVLHLNGFLLLLRSSPWKYAFIGFFSFLFPIPYTSYYLEAITDQEEAKEYNGSDNSEEPPRHATVIVVRDIRVAISSLLIGGALSIVVAAGQGKAVLRQAVNFWHDLAVKLLID